MALRAQLFGSLLSDAPLMRGMAGQALVTEGLKMHRVLAAFHGALVALRTGGFGRLFRVMDLVTVVAFKRLMRQ